MKLAPGLTLSLARTIGLNALKQRIALHSIQLEDGTNLKVMVKTASYTGTVLSFIIGLLLFITVTPLTHETLHRI